jgi:hypothetical protein
MRHVQRSNLGLARQVANTELTTSQPGLAGWLGKPAWRSLLLIQILPQPLPCGGPGLLSRANATSART